MEGRTKKTINNVAFGVLQQISTMLLTFITRTVFIKVLNESFLGINGLFSNILSILSIAELGFGTAIVYGMYKPIAENDTRKIAALMNYYKKIYNILALTILIIGLSIIPFLKYLVNLEQPMDYLIVYYLIFLGDSVCSYLLANRTAIIYANQNLYVTNKYNIFFNTLRSVLQIIALLVFKNFIIYLLIQVIVTLLNNLYGASIAKKLYPYAFQKAELEKEDKKNLVDNVKSMAMYRFGGVIMNNTDNILTSIISGTVTVGFYSNYNTIITFINNFVNIVFNSITASLGNLNAGSEKEKKINMFYNMTFFVNWLVGFCTIALFVLFNDFITIWIGEKYLLDSKTVFAIVLNFYIIGTLRTALIYRDTTGLFKQTKYVGLITAFINLILSIILGKQVGIFGILIASSIARLVTNFWFEPYMLLNTYFKTTSKRYFSQIFLNVLLVIGSCWILRLIFNFVNGWHVNRMIEFIIKVILTGFISNSIFYIFYRKKAEFKYFKSMAIKFIKKGMTKGKK